MLMQYKKNSSMRSTPKQNIMKYCEIIGFCAFVMLIRFDVGESVIELKSLLVPERVENGTEESVVLDCIYSFDEDDDKQLVVKWFFNDDPEPIYQWIPELNSRTASDRLKGKINMDFAVNTGNPYTKYRAINLVRPTTDQSGRYVCHVASLKSEASKEASFLVYTRNIQNYPDKIDSSRYSVGGSSLSTFHPPPLILWAGAYFLAWLVGLRGR